MHPGGPGLLAKGTHGLLDGLLDRRPRAGEVDPDQPALVLDHAAVDEHGVDVAALRLEGDVYLRVQ